MKKTACFFVMFFSVVSCSWGQTAKFISLENNVSSLLKAYRWDDLLMTAPELITEDPTRGEGYYYTALAFCKLQSVKEAKEYLEMGEKLTNDAILTQKINDLKIEIAALETFNTTKEKVSKLNEKATAEDYKKLWELDKSQIEYAISSIELYVKDENYVFAIAILDDPILSKDESAKALRNKLNNTPKMKALNSYNSAMSAGEMKFNSGNFDSAIDEFEKALKIFKNDKNASVFLKKSKEEAAWSKAKNSKYVDDYEKYVDAYPRGKYDEAANITIKKSYISIAEKAYLNSNESQLVQFHDKYLKRFPGDDGIKKIRDLLLEFYLKSGNTNLAEKDWYDAKKYFQLYLNISSYGIDADKCRKSIKKCEWKLKQRSADFIAYSYDSICPIGVSFGKLNKNGIGYYSTLRLNSNIFTSLNGTIDDNGNKVLDRFSEAQTQTRLNETSYANASASLGLTIKLVYPLYLYIGGGVIYSSLYDKWEASDPNYIFQDVDRKYWLRNTDKTAFDFFPESGLILKVSNVLILKYGVIYNKDVIHQFALGFQL